MSFSELGSEQHRQLIDAVETFGAWREASIEHRRRFSGSMRWVERSGKQYLLRKIGANERSLGPKSENTEQAYERFMGGREANSDRLSGLVARLDQMAPINKAMGLGRIPRIAARILRELDERELLGHQIFVVGTNALFAYEARAGVRIASGLLATGDVDLLFDARQRLSFVGRKIREIGLVGLLKRLDHSFAPVRKGGFRAVNRDGYYVDLIRPEPRDMMRDQSPDALSALPDELRGSPIHGLAWLVSAPRFDAVSIAEDGYPTRLVCLDPRIFALHKAWISGDEKRDPLKKLRDLEQAKTCAALASRLGLSFDEAAALSVLPESIRALKPMLLERSSDGPLQQDGRRTTPNW